MPTDPYDPDSMATAVWKMFKPWLIALVGLVVIFLVGAGLFIGICGTVALERWLFKASIYLTQ